MTEKVVQRNAFEYFYNLGDKRSLEDVAVKFGVTKRTVAGWSSKYRWTDKLAQRKLEELRKKGFTEDLHKETLAIRAEYRSVMKKLLDQVEKDINEGKIKIESIEDLEIIIKLDLLLMGEATEIKDHRLFLEVVR